MAEGLLAAILHTPQEALRQLYALDAIDRDGDVTDIGRRMAVLPLEPALARALLAAGDLKCVLVCGWMRARACVRVYEGVRGLSGQGGMHSVDCCQQPAAHCVC